MPSLCASLWTVALVITMTATAAYAQPSDQADASKEAKKGEAKKRKKRVKLRTLPPDLSYGEVTVPNYALIPEPALGDNYVDRRDVIDPLASQHILLPNALTPKAGSWSYANFFLAGNQLSYSPSDDLQLTATLVLPSDLIDASHYIDLMTMVSGKYTVYEERSAVLSVSLFGLYRAGTREIDTSEAGLGLGLLYDFYPHNRVAMTLGALAYAPMWGQFDFQSSEACVTRNEFISGSCLTIESESQGLPAAGQWFALYLGATIYGNENLALKGELISGVTNGAFLDQESAIEFRDDIVDQRARYASSDWQVGLPWRRPLTLGIGAQYTYKRFAANLSLYALFGESLSSIVGDFDTLVFRPMTSVAFGF